jgi:tetratricopeptide (TPR) repeat protein
MLAVLSGAILADVACVKNVRTVNDNFYVINRKRSSNMQPVAPDPVPHPSASSAETSKSQASSGPRPKSVLSNLGILEEENSTISSLLRKVQSDPANALAHFQLGRAYHDFRLYDEALRHYQRALELEQNPVYYEQTGRLWRDWGSFELGANLVKRALELEPGFIEAWNTLGTIFDHQGALDRAQDAYLQALSLNPDLGYVHSNLCFSYLRSGKVEQAILHGLRATHLNPTIQVAHYNLGLAYGAVGEFERSFEEFKLSSDEAEARNNLGLMLLRDGQITESMEQFRLAARMRPYYKDAAVNYRQARDLRFQREREARARLRFFDHETQMEAKSGAMALVAIQNAGPKFYDGTFNVLFSADLVAHPPDQKEFGELLGPRPPR